MRSETIPVAMSIAGFDPSGGAGVTADLRIMRHAGVYGIAALTAVTVQNAGEVREVYHVDSGIVAGQIDILLEDVKPAASKTGILGSAETVAVLLERRHSLGRLVLDPVTMSTSGAPLVSKEAAAAIRETLVPECDLVVPNLAEATELTGIRIDTIEDAFEAARALVASGAKAACVTGGHWPDASVDILFDGEQLLKMGERDGRLDQRFHGTGCSFSAAAAAGLASGMGITEAVRFAREKTREALENAVKPGRGPAVPWPPGQLEPPAPSD